MLHGSTSAPALAASREPQGYTHSERVTRKVPPLVLVPLDQLQQLQQRKEKETQGEELNDKKVRRRRQRRAEVAAAEDGGGEREEREERQQRLGERFLGMMALLARLRRMDLEETSSLPDKTERRLARRSPLRSSRSATATPVVVPLKEEKKKPSAYELLVQKKKAERNRGVVLSVSTEGSMSAIQLSPHRKPEPVVNEATALLREHLTFEISMLLPQPMDTRQSALESPIRRKKRRKRLRRKKRRLGATIVDGKRTWSTSHATWVPHASADYAKARSQEAVAAQASSKLVAKFAALKHAVRGSKIEEQQQQWTYLYANEKEERRQRSKGSGESRPGRRGEDDRELVGEREEDGEEEEEEEEQEIPAQENNSGEDDDQEEEDQEEEEEEEEEDDALPELLHPLSTASAPLLPPPKRAPLRQPPTVSVIRSVQTHQAAWISPELRRWLISSGLFRTTSKPTLSSSS